MRKNLRQHSRERLTRSQSLPNVLPTLRQADHQWSASLDGAHLKLPIVLCPGCQKPMTPGEPRPLVNTPLVEITYVCGSCGTTTERTIKQPE